MNRRNFISTLIGATAMTTLHVPNLFMVSLGERAKHILRRDGTTLKSIHIDPIEEIGGEQFRFVRLWVEEWEKPLTWYQPY